jgi:transmembrane sensor
MKQNGQNIDEHILLQYLLGNADEASRARVEEWLKAAGGNRRHLDRLESLWLETGRIIPPPVAVDVDAAWNRLNTRIGMEDHQPASLRDRWTTKAIWAAAASVLLIVGIFTIFKLAEGSRQIEIASLDKVLIDTLPDGSRIILNRNSTLTCPEVFDAGFREVKLSGEACFDVKHDSLQPFFVDAGIAKVRVMGTSFRVNTHPDGVTDPDGVVEVSVTQGRVMLFRVDETLGDTLSLFLMAGESGMMKEGTLRPVKTDAASPDDLFWANHTLDFRSTALSEVFVLLEKYHPVKVSVNDPAILDCRLTASFVNEPADRILAVIAESFGLKLEVNGNKYQLTGNGCSKAGN